MKRYGRTAALVVAGLLALDSGAGAQVPGSPGGAAAAPGTLPSPVPATS